MNSLFLLCWDLISCKEKKVWQHDSSQSPQIPLEKKKFNMQLLCQTGGRNGFILQSALWQVHCGRIDSYMGGKWIVITCLVFMTLGWVPSDLLQDFWIGLLFSLQLAADEDMSLLFTGQELSHSQVTHQSPCYEICEVEPQKCKRNIGLSFLFAYSNIKRRIGGWREEEEKKCGMAALLGMVID